MAISEKEKCLTCEQALLAAVRQAYGAQSELNCSGGKGPIEDDLVIKGWAKNVDLCQKQGRFCPKVVKKALACLLEPQS
jgi:molybdopterin-biosynthesis enzyme MoeA-like protein